MPQATARTVPVITVKNTSNLPHSIKSKDGQTITIMPNQTSRISANFASVLPNGPVRKIA